MPPIETTALTKRFGDVLALDRLDLTVREGEVFGFLGPNGAGKSTTINLLLGYLTPTGGSGSVLGHDIESDACAARSNIGVLPEGYSSFDRMTGHEHVEYIIDAKDADDDPDALLDRTGLDPAARSRRVDEYSTGMYQRMALAMALVGDPDLLVLDEPTAGLDPNGAMEMRNIVREERERGAAVFFSSHVLGQVEAVCDRVGIMREGSLVTVDTIEGLRDRLATESTVTLDVTTNPGLTLTSLDGVSDIEWTGSELAVTCTAPSAKAEVIRRVADATQVEDVSITDASLDELFSLVTQQATGTEQSNSVEGVA